MLDKGIEAFASKSGFTVEKDSAIGIYFKYLVTLYNDSGRNAFYINYITPENDESDAVSQIEDRLKEWTDEYSIVSFKCDDGGLTVSVKGDSTDCIRLLDACVELLSETGVYGCDHCSYCGEDLSEKPAKKVNVNGLNYIACESCALGVIEENAKASAPIPAPTKKQSALGTLLAAVGGIIGVALYFVIYAFVVPLFKGDKNIDVTFIACFLGFITSVLVYFGYVLFVKKDSVSAKLTVGAFSLFFSAIGQYIGIVCLIYNDLGLNRLIPRILLMPFRSNGVNITNYASLFYFRLGISLLFAACGAFIFLLGLYDRNHATASKVEVESIKILSKD